MSTEAVLDAAIELTEAAADLLKDFALSGGGMPQLVPYDLVGQVIPNGGLRATQPTSRLVAAGIAVVAQDTGRVLLIQRSTADPADPAKGKWEFPGGRCEADEGAWACAAREWQEEMGVKLPAGAVAGQWDSSNGVYRCYVWLIDSEKQIDLHGGREEVLNPDDPDKDDIETAAWWNPSDLLNMPALRTEVAEQTDWGMLRSFQANKHIFAELEALGRYLRHGKKIEKFRVDWLPIREVKLIAAEAAKPGEAIARSRARMIGKFNVPARASNRAAQREQALRSIVTETAAKLGALARDAHSSHLGFVDEAARTLRNAYAKAYLIGRKHARLSKQADGEEEQSYDDLEPDVQDDIDRDVERQHQFLQGLTQDLVAGLGGAALEARLDQYASTTIGPYEEGYQDGAIAGLMPADAESGGIMATWVVTSEDPCALCEEKNGETWPAEEAPLPGDGDFGELCEGAMNCRCVLEYEYTPTDEGVANPAADFEAA